jgi:hypothetical protein
MLSALWGWLVAFFFTQLFELPIYYWATKRWRIGFFASAITHPVVWFIFPLTMELGAPYWVMVALAEVFAVVAEGFWLRHHGIARAFAWSLLANATSATLGLVLRTYFGVP